MSVGVNILWVSLWFFVALHVFVAIFVFWMCCCRGEGDVRQIYALLMKDLTLQIRQWKSNLCQLITPVLVMLFLLLLQVIVNEVLIPLFSDDDDDIDTRVVDGATYIFPAAANFLEVLDIAYDDEDHFLYEDGDPLYQGGTIGYDTNFDEGDLINDYFRPRLDVYSFEDVPNDEMDTTLYDGLRVKEAERRTGGLPIDYFVVDKYLGHIDFETWETDSFEYTIQYQYYLDWFQTRTYYCEIMNFLGEGYCEYMSAVALADVANTAYFKERTNGNLTVGTWIAQQPYEDLDGDFEVDLASILGIYFYPMILLLAFPTVLYVLVVERESQLKEMMKMAGLKERNYFVSTFLFKHFWVLLSILFFYLLGYLLKHQMLTQTHPLILLLTFEGVAFHLVAMAFLMASFIDSSFLASVFGYFSVIFIPLVASILLSVLTAGDGNQPDWEFKWLLLIPFFPVVDVCLRLLFPCLGFICLNNDFAWEYKDFVIALASLYVTGMIAVIISRYLEEVSPKTWGIQKHPLFFLCCLCDCINTTKKCCVQMNEKEEEEEEEEEIDQQQQQLQQLQMRRINDIRRKKGKKKDKKDDDDDDDDEEEEEEEEDVEFEGFDDTEALVKEKKKNKRLPFEDEDVYDERVSILKRVKTKKNSTILIKGIRKVFGRGYSRNVAVNDVYFAVKNKMCFGLLGPNGAGKTTLIRMLSGLFGTSKGTAFISGHNIKNEMDQIRLKLGLCPQFTVSWDSLTAREHLLFYSRLKGVPANQERKQVDDILDTVGLLEKDKGGRSKFGRCGDVLSHIWNELIVKYAKLGYKLYFHRGVADEGESTDNDGKEEEEEGENSDNDEEDEEELDKEEELDDIIEEEEQKKEKNKKKKKKKKKKKSGKKRFQFPFFRWLVEMVSFVIPSEKLSSQLSGGMRRRLALAISLTGRPDVVLLDEPTTGLDPSVRKKVWDVIESVKRERCVILTTHSMEEAEKCCDDIAIMSRGRLICKGTPLRLKNRHGNGYTLSVKCEKEENSESVKKKIESNDSFGGMYKPSLIRKFGQILVFEIRPPLTGEPLRVSNIFETLENQKKEYGIIDFELNQTTLEDVFLNVVRKNEERYIKKMKKRSKGIGSNMNAESCLKGIRSVMKRIKGSEDYIDDDDDDDDDLEYGSKEEVVEDNYDDGEFKNKKKNKNKKRDGSEEEEEEELEDTKKENTKKKKKKNKKKEKKKKKKKKVEQEEVEEVEEVEEEEEEEEEPLEKKVLFKKKGEEADENDDDESDGSSGEENEGGESTASENEEKEEEEEEKEESNDSESQEEEPEESEESDDDEVGAGERLLFDSYDDDEEHMKRKRFRKPSLLCTLYNFLIRDTFIQTFFLFRKNYVLMIRGWKIFFFLFLSPLLVIFFIEILIWIIQTDEEEWYITPPRTDVETNPPGICNSHNRDYGECYTFAFAHNNDPFAENVIDKIVEAYNYVLDTDYVLKTSQDELEMFMALNRNKTLTGVSFYNEEMRRNISLPNNGTFDVYYQLYFNGTNDFVISRGPTIIEAKIMIDNFIYNEFMEITGGPNVGHETIQIKKEPFPKPRDWMATYAEGEMMGGVGPLFFCLAACILFIVALYKIVVEKETGLRQYLEMIGMKRIPYFCSWNLNFCCYNAIMTMMVVYTLTSLALCLSTLVKTGSAAMVLGFLLMAFTFILNLVLTNEFLITQLLRLKFPYSLIPLGFELTYSPFNFAKMFNDINGRTLMEYNYTANEYQMNDGFFGFDMLFGGKPYVDIENGQEVLKYDQPPSISLLFMILNALVYVVFFFYLDMVISGKYKLCFFLKPCCCCCCGGITSLNFCTNCCCDWILDLFWDHFGMTIGRDEVTGNLKFVRKTKLKTANGVDMNSKSKSLTVLRETNNDILAEYRRARDNTTKKSLRILNLKKTFHTLWSRFYLQNPVRAVNGLDLSINRNEIVAVLGPNGAGKTTAVSQVAGTLKPNSGEIFVNEWNRKYYPDNVRSVLGMTLQHDVLWGDMSAQDHLILAAQMKGRILFPCFGWIFPSCDPFVWSEVKNRLEEVSLFNWRNKPAGTFSGGMKRRLSVAMGFTSNPILCILDEPTTGLDPFSKREVWEVIKKKKLNSSVLLTTHSMEEADALSDKIMIMKDGYVACVGDSLTLKKNHGEGFMLNFSTLNIPEFLEFIKIHFPHAKLKKKSITFLQKSKQQQQHQQQGGGGVSSTGSKNLYTTPTTTLESSGSSIDYTRTGLEDDEMMYFVRDGNNNRTKNVGSVKEEEEEEEGVESSQSSTNITEREGVFLYSLGKEYADELISGLKKVEEHIFSFTSGGGGGGGMDDDEDEIIEEEEQEGEDEEEEYEKGRSEEVLTIVEEASSRSRRRKKKKKKNRKRIIKEFGVSNTTLEDVYMKVVKSERLENIEDDDNEKVILPGGAGGSREEEQEESEDDDDDDSDKDDDEEEEEDIDSESDESD